MIPAVLLCPLRERDSRVWVMIRRGKTRTATQRGERGEIFSWIGGWIFRECVSDLRVFPKSKGRKLGCFAYGWGRKSNISREIHLSKKARGVKSGQAERNQFRNGEPENPRVKFWVNAGGWNGGRWWDTMWEWRVNCGLWLKSIWPKYAWKHTIIKFDEQMTSD